MSDEELEKLWGPGKQSARGPRAEQEHRMDPQALAAMTTDATPPPQEK